MAASPQSPESPPMSWGAQQSGSPSAASPTPTSPLGSPSSPLLGTKFENMFRPISKSTPSNKVAEVEVAATPLSDADLKVPASDIKARPVSQYVERFPDHPEKLSYLPSSRWYILLDMLLTMIPVVFIVYGILAACLYGRPTSSYYFGDDGYNWSGSLYGPVMLRVQKVIPTIFPMGFGITVARLIHAFALWRAQSGTQLGFLEQLVGSTSLAGTVSSLWGLRILNWIGVVLFAMWALAPAGSQAGLRIISDNGTWVDTNDLYYMDTNAIPTGLQTEDNEIQYYTYAVNALYSTSVLTPSAMAGPQDPWTNVKLPSLEWLERNDGCDASGWCSRDLAKKRNSWNESVVTAGTWTSLTGVPIVGGQFGLGFQQFTLLASYYAFNCTSLSVVDPSENFSSALPSRSVYDTSNVSTIWNSGNADHPNTFFIDTSTPLAGLGNSSGEDRLPGVNMAPRDLIFGSRAPDGTTLGRCTMGTSYVQAEVLCNFTAPLWNIDKTSSGRTAAGACYVDRVRRDPEHPNVEPYTPFDLTYRVADRFFTQWPLATGNIPTGSSSPTERFINDVNSDSAIGAANPILVATDWLGFNRSDTDNDGGVSYVDISKLDLQNFQERFSLLFNTYWHSFCNLQAMTQSEIGLGFGVAFPPNVMFLTAQAQTSIPGQYFAVNFAFLGVYMFCCVVALLAAVLTLVLQYRTLVPDVLGSISTLVKENPYTPLPDGGSRLDGHEFARHVMRMPVKIADVRPQAAVGHIALTSIDVEDTHVQVAPITKDRFYH